MRKSRFTFASPSARRVVLTALAVLISCAAANAQATRTWVSGVGDDANPCSRTAPCKTFAGAISKTAPGGEIDVLDPGGFGAVTITKSISIEANGLIAGVLVSGTNAIIINAPAGSVVVLRGLTFEGLGTGLTAVLFQAGGALYVEDCFINNFTAKGIDFNPSAGAALFVKDTVIRNNLGANSGGIDIRGSASFATLDHVRLENNQFGLKNEAGKTVLRDSEVSRSTGNGVFATAGEINTQHVAVFGNVNGVISTGGVIRLSDTTIADNTVGISTSAANQVFTYNNNQNGGNATPGAPQGPVTPGGVQ